MAALIITILLNIATIINPVNQPEKSNTINTAEDSQTITTLGGTTTWNEAGN